MKKYVKIAVLSVLAVALAAALYMVSKQPEKQNEEDENKVLPTLSVRVLDEELSGMTLENAEGTFSFSKAEDGGWLCNFRDNAKAYGNTVIALESMLKQTLAVELIEENTQSLSKYGLDEPTAMLTGTGTSGNEYFIKIGNSIVGSKYYFTVDNSCVYTISADEGGLYMAGMGAFVKLSLTDYKIESITSVSVSNENVLEIVKKDTQALKENTADALFSYAVISPVTANASPTATQSLFESMASVGAKNFIASPDGEETAIDSEKYFSVTTEEGTVTYYIGAKTQNGYYVQKHGESGAYIVDESQLKFMDTKLLNIVDKHIALHYIDEVSSVEIASPEGNYTVVFGDASTVNSKPADSERTADFYEALISLCYDAVLKEGSEASQTPEVTITFNTSSGRETAEFYSVDVMNYEVRKNGVFGLTIQKKYIDKILNIAKEL